MALLFCGVWTLGEPLPELSSPLGPQEPCFCLRLAPTLERCGGKATQEKRELRRTPGKVPSQITSDSLSLKLRQVIVLKSLLMPVKSLL